jgi:hypothetical protein
VWIGLRFVAALARDVIYYYGPFADDAIQASIERRVEEDLRRGPIVLANRKLTHDWRASGDFDLLTTDGSMSWAFRKCRK